MATTITYTAIITATGTDSAVPDNETAVDADIEANGEPVGSVTLLRDHTGELVSWGDLDMWADAALIRWLDGQEDRYAAKRDIVAAVNVAAEKV